MVKIDIKKIRQTITYKVWRNVNILHYDILINTLNIKHDINDILESRIEVNLIHDIKNKTRLRGRSHE